MASTVSARSAGPPAITVEHVSKAYRRPSLFPRRRAAVAAERLALDDVSMIVEPGETVGLLGPNGAGKTTLLKTIATLLYPTRGRVLLSGVDVQTQPTVARGLLGLVTCDERSFFWRLTGRHNLFFFATLYGLTRPTAERRLDELLETLGLTDAADRPYHGYSSGMKQKMAIARGLLAEPKIMLYDEPTRSLDPLTTQNIRRWIVEHRSKVPWQTHLIATNQLDEAEALCDRVLIINRGKVVAQGTMREIRDRWHRQEYEIHRVVVAGFTPDGRLQADEESGLLDVTVERESDREVTLLLRLRKDSRALSHVLGVILESGGTVLRCDVEEVPFDDVFCTIVLGGQAKEPAC